MIGQGHIHRISNDELQFRMEIRNEQINDLTKMISIPHHSSYMRFLDSPAFNMFDELQMSVEHEEREILLVSKRWAYKKWFSRDTREIVSMSQIPRVQYEEVAQAVFESKLFSSNLEQVRSISQGWNIVYTGRVWVPSEMTEQQLDEFLNETIPECEIKRR